MYHGHTQGVWMVAWSPDGQSIASCGEDGTIQVWSALTGKASDTFRYGGDQRSTLFEVAWSPSVRMDEWFARKHRGRWYRLSVGWGSKGPRWFDWAWRKMDGDVPEGWQAWVVVRRSITDPTEVVYHRVCAPKQTTLRQIVEVAGQRWKGEEAIERAKGECGLDQYEVRSWTGWYRHITLSLLAHLCATLMMEQANAEPEKKPGNPGPA
jgi:SRSO17 transposase